MHLLSIEPPVRADFYEGIRSYALTYQGEDAVKVALAANYIYENEPMLAGLIVEWHELSESYEAHQLGIIESIIESNPIETIAALDHFIERTADNYDDGEYYRQQVDVRKEIIDGYVWSVIDF